jgi:hypothetical protein
MDSRPSIRSTPGRPSRRGWQVFGGLVVLALAATWWFYFHDEPPPDDSDLAFSVTPVPAEKNGLVQLAKFPIASLDFTSFAQSHGLTGNSAIDDILRNQSRRDPLVDAFLAQAQPAFTKLDALLALPHFQNPGSLSLDVKFPELPVVKVVAIALRLEIIRSMQKGDYATATQDTLRLRLLASRMTEGYAYLLQYITANSVYGLSAVSARDLLNAPDLPALQLVTLVHAYTANEPAMAAFQRTLTLEYQFSLAALRAEEQQEVLFQPKNPAPGWGDRLSALWYHYNLKPNATQRQLASFYRDWRMTVGGPYGNIDLPALNARRLGIGQNAGQVALVTWVLAPNAGGRYFLALSAGSPDVLQYPYWEIAVDRLLRTGFALRMYYADNGSFPHNLDTLTPAYLPKLPNRPFDEPHFRYDPSHGRIYSVGTTLRDLGGSPFTHTASTAANYVDPLMDTSQPTLVLTFQNTMKPPVVLPQS